MRREILTNLNTGGDLCQSRVVVARRKEHNKDEQPQHERRRRRRTTKTTALFFSLFLSSILGLSRASGRASRNGVCLSLSFPGVEDTFKIFQFRVFESAVVGTSDARKNAATKVRRQQRARATGGVRRETPRQSRKSGDGEERARKRVKERERKKQRSVFPFYSAICTSRYY